MEDYVELRLGLFVFLFLLMALIQFVFFNKQEKIMKYKKYYLIFIFSCSILSMLIFMFPYESVIVKNKVYDTVEEQFRYMYPEYKIEKVFKHDDYGYVHYLVNGKNGYMGAIYKDKKWIFRYPDFTVFLAENYDFYINDFKFNNSFLIRVSSYNSLKQSMNIVDSNEILYTDCSSERDGNYYDLCCYVDVQNIDDDYYLLVDGNKFYLKDMLENGM